MSAALLDKITKSAPDGLYLTVRAKPATAKEKALRVVEIGDGKFALEVSVKAAAQDGKANKALCERLAGLFGVARSRVTLVSGDKARIKAFYVQGDPQILAHKLGALLTG